MWESEGSAVVGGDVWDLLLADVLLDDLAKLEASLLSINLVWDESSLNIKKDSKELVGLVDGNNIHLTKWVSVVSSDLAVDLDEALLLSTDFDGLLSGEGILQSLLKQN